MSFIGKIYVSFLFLIAIAVILGIIGWASVSNLNTAMDKTVEYTFSAESHFAVLRRLPETINSAQRTLLIGSISDAERAQQHQNFQNASAEMRSEMANIDALLRDGQTVIQGWDKVSTEWEKTRDLLNAWSSGSEEAEVKIKSWEMTTILNPDSLLRDIQTFRGDHYSLATRLGTMISAKENSGDDITASDTACAFGKWRQRFEQGELSFSKNANMMKAVDLMTLPHRNFHQTAHDLQALIKTGFQKNADAIAEMYKHHLAAAAKVIDTFRLMRDEAERARVLFQDAETLSVATLRDLRDKAVSELNLVSNLNSEVARGTSKEAMDDGAAGVARMSALSVGTVIVGLVFIIFLSWTIKRQLTAPLAKTIRSLTENANTVSDAAVAFRDASVALAEGSQNQSAALEETSAAMEEITSMARKNLDNSRSADGRMQETAKAIAEGSHAVDRMGQAMTEIRDSSEKVGGILKTIEEIAFQTNLLALNAAVEAARAGEAGKGFAVVAEEVRNLAQRSGNAVKDTSSLIKGTVEKVTNGVAISNEICERFNAITCSTDDTVRMLNEIKTAAGEQAIGLDQISTSITQIDAVNQANARTAGDSSDASVSLTESSENVMDEIGMLNQVFGQIIGKKAAVKATAGNDRALSHSMRPTPTVTASQPMKALPPPQK